MNTPQKKEMAEFDDLETKILFQHWNHDNFPHMDVQSIFYGTKDDMRLLADIMKQGFGYDRTPEEIETKIECVIYYYLYLKEYFMQEKATVDPGWPQFKDLDKIISYYYEKYQQPNGHDDINKSKFNGDSNPPLAPLNLEPTSHPPTTSQDTNTQSKQINVASSSLASTSTRVIGKSKAEQQRKRKRSLNIEQAIEPAVSSNQHINTNGVNKSLPFQLPGTPQPIPKNGVNTARTANKTGPIKYDGLSIHLLEELIKVEALLFPQNMVGKEEEDLGVDYDHTKRRRHGG